MQRVMKQKLSGEEEMDERKWRIVTGGMMIIIN
jgi:hypothetical protein